MLKMLKMPYEEGNVMDKTTRKARFQYWADALRRCARECAERGISKKQWIEEQGVSVKTFYNWQRRIRKAAAEQMERKAELTETESPVLAELPVARFVAKEEETDASGFKPAAVVRMGRIEVELSDGALPELLRWLQGTMTDAQ